MLTAARPARRYPRPTARRILAEAYGAHALLTGLLVAVYVRQGMDGQSAARLVAGRVAAGMGNTQ